MNHTVTANFDLVCACTQPTLIAHIKRPLATYLFCKRCGGVRNRIMPFVFKMQRAHQ